MAGSRSSLVCRGGGAGPRHCARFPSTRCGASNCPKNVDLQASRLRFLNHEPLQFRCQL